MVVERVRVVTFLLKGAGTYTSGDGETLSVRTTASSVTLEGSSIPDRGYEAYAFPAGAGPQSLGDIDVRGGIMNLALPSETWAAAQQAGEIILLYYDSSTTFPQPTDGPQ